MTKATKKVADEVDKIFVKEQKQKVKQYGVDDGEEMLYIGNNKNARPRDDSGEFDKLVNATKKPVKEGGTKYNGLDEENAEA